MMQIARGGWTWIVGPLVLGGVFCGGAWLAGWPGVAGVMCAAGMVASGFMVFFFRDPDRDGPDDPGAIVAGADGLVRAVEELPEHTFLKADTVRISIFLSPFDVHVNRAPIAGEIEKLEYTPGKHLLTIRNAASEYNEHSSILIAGSRTRCLVKQIVGPVVRRVVYWLTLSQSVGRGERIGMMKFGSRLDMYFPRDDVLVIVKKGDKVRAGETIVATLSKD